MLLHKTLKDNGQKPLILPRNQKIFPHKQSFINIGVGAAGAVASYGLTGEGMKSGAVSPQTLIIGVVGAAVLLAIVAILRREIAR